MYTGIMQNILIINYEFPPVGGGGGVATYYIARELCRKGYEVSVLTSRFGSQRWRETIENIRVYRVPVLRKRRDYCSVLEMATFILSSIPMLFFLLLTCHYDLIHIFFGVPSGPLGYLAKKIFGVPYLIRMGGGDVPGFRPFQYKKLYKILTPFLNILWRNADFLVANSDGLCKMASGVFPDLPICVIPNGVDTRRFTNGHRRSPAPVVRILFVSRLIRRKGLQFLIEAIPQIAQQAKFPFVIKVVGDGPDKQEFLQLVKENRVEEHIRFYGYVDHADLPHYYLDADIFVLPSLAEGMPNVVLEAMGSGLPVVATRVAGSEELVQDGENGFLVDAKNVEALAQALITLINQPELREQMSKGAKMMARKYTWNIVTEHYTALYEQMARVHCLSAEFQRMA
ncbi:glycosyl transferase group 1 [Candidatus Vecturithrix granuli]|uniref:Glycosyl transferase group 1 n=1 Tax=Vecturithrix granuli TaxID=1499967 RepID=A0A081BXE8_VECG1|nr:glycosyl transferase group 1 [Candidatus Vecturithrix granuli]